MVIGREDVGSHWELTRLGVSLYLEKSSHRRANLPSSKHLMAPTGTHLRRIYALRVAAAMLLALERFARAANKATVGPSRRVLRPRQPFVTSPTVAWHHVGKSLTTTE
jgi:hypothetical protein